MSETLSAVLDAGLVFGAAPGLAPWQLWRLRREARPRGDAPPEA
ncbi:hypothetical protein [Methylobacterium sp. ID0610]